MHSINNIADSISAARRTQSPTVSEVVGSAFRFFSTRRQSLLLLLGRRRVQNAPGQTQGRRGKRGEPVAGASRRKEEG